MRIPRDEVIHDLPWAQGLAMIAWAIESDPFLSVERKTKGYIAQEIERLKKL